MTMMLPKIEVGLMNIMRSSNSIYIWWLPNAKDFVCISKRQHPNVPEPDDLLRQRVGIVTVFAKAVACRRCPLYRSNLVQRFWTPMSYVSCRRKCVCRPMYLRLLGKNMAFIHSLRNFYSTSSSPLLLRGAPGSSTVKKNSFKTTIECVRKRPR